MKIQGVQLVRRKAKDGIGVARIENYYLCTATYAVPSADNEGWTLVEEGETIPTPTASAPYLWHKTITVMTDGTSLAPVIEFCGSLGQNGFDYDLVPSASIILKDSDGNMSPTTISCSLIRREADGSATKMNSVPTGYSVKFKYEQYPEMDYTLGMEGQTSAISTVVSFLLYYGDVLVERHDIRVVSEGAQGVDGRGIQSLDYRFKAIEKNTAPTAPTSDAEWSDQWFSLDSAGYSAEKPYLYRCVKTVYVDGLKNATTEYAVDGPTVWGEKGDTGNGIKSEVKVYSVTADTSTEPTAWLENWFNLLVILNPNYPYVWECTKTTYTNGDVAYLGKHIIGMNTDYVEKGTQYALGDNGTTEPTSGWANTYTATEGKWLWERTEYKWQRVAHTYTAGTCKGYFPEKGKNGEAGMVMRVTEWQEGTEYHNDEGKDLSPRYLDIVTVTNADGTFEAYQCKQTHTSDSAVNPPDNNDYWTKMNNMRPIYTPLIVAQNAVMRLAQSNQVVIVNSDNKVQGCFGGVDDETNGYPLWMGGETADKAKFKVKYDGVMEARAARMSGFIFKDKVVINDDNYSDYFDGNPEAETWGADIAYFNLEKAGAWVEFDINALPATGGPEVTLPDIYAGADYDNEGNLMYARSLVGNTVMFYNKGAQEIYFTGNYKSSESAIGGSSFTLKTGEFVAMECKASTQSITIVEYPKETVEREEIYWLYKKGQYKTAT